MKVEAYIHSLKDHENNRHVLGEAEIIRNIGSNLYLAEYKLIRPPFCTAMSASKAPSYERLERIEKEGE